MTTTEAPATTALAAPPQQRPPSIALGPTGLQLRTFEDTQRVARTAVLSGFYPALNKGHDSFESAIAQATMKIVYGAELGISPLAAMQGIIIVEGKLSLAAGLIASLIFRSGRVKYKLTKHSPTECTLRWVVDDDDVGESSFTWEDAQRAGVTGKHNWKSYPKAMLFARALTQGARMFCPFIFHGAIYCPEELGSEGVDDVVLVNKDGEPQGVGPNATPKPVPEVEQPPAAKAKGGTDTLKAAAAKAKAEEAIIDVEVDAPPAAEESVVVPEPEGAAPDDEPSAGGEDRDEPPREEPPAASELLLEALRTTPKDGGKQSLAAHLCKWQGKLSKPEAFSLQVWSRWVLNKASGHPEHAKLTPDGIAEVERLKGLTVPVAA